METVACSCSHMPPPYSSEIQQPMRTTATLGRYRPQTYVPGCTIDRDPDRADSLASRWSGRGSTSPPAPGIAQLGTGQPYAALVCTCPCACPVKHQAGLDTCPCAALPNLAVLDQDGACGAVGPALAPGSALRTPARRAPGHRSQGTHINTAGTSRRPGKRRAIFLAARLSRSRPPRLDRPAASLRDGCASPGLAPARHGYGACRERQGH